MTRSKRIDYPGAWHHVMNRGIARRNAFETRFEVRFFLSLVAREVRRGRLEIHAYCVLSTHFHFLVRSPVGELSAAMQWIENCYVRWFNRRRDRDGALFRGRFHSKLVECERYQRTLVRYIDLNSVTAGIAEDPADYEHGSAFHRHRESQPLWLAQDWVQSELRRATGRGFGAAKTYAEVFGSVLSSEQSTWIETRVRRARDGDDDFASLFEAASPKIRAWMIRRAKLADGTKAGVPIVGPRSALATLGRFRPAIGGLSIASGKRRIPAETLLVLMLLRDVCASSYREVAARLGISVPTARSRYRLHAIALTESTEYAARAAELVRLAMDDFLPP